MAEIADIAVSAWDVPTETPESDGTAEWKKTTLVLVELSAGGQRGIGWTYADSATASIVRDVLAEHLRGMSPFDTRRIYDACVRAVRNHGRGGVSAMAISAVDIAAW